MPFLRMRWIMLKLSCNIIVILLLCACASTPKMIVKGMCKDYTAVTQSDARHLAVIDALCHLAEYEGKQNSYDRDNYVFIETRWQFGTIALYREFKLDKSYKMISSLIEIFDNSKTICRIENDKILFMSMNSDELLKKLKLKEKTVRTENNLLIVELVR